MKSIIITTLLLLITITSDAQQHPLTSDHQQEYELPNPVHYLALGDSWASGVNWGPPSAETEYNFPNDGEVCRCRRMREAYPVQLLDDSDRSWIGDRELQLDFQACHGAFLGHIAGQMERAGGERIDVATLMIGGNDAGFGDIVEECLVQIREGYGGEYPEPEGGCAKTLGRAHEIIGSVAFRRGLWTAIMTVLRDERVWRNTHFRLYVLGYAGLFNHDDEKCNEWSFGFFDGRRPKLTRELRRALNGVLDHARSVYEEAVNHALFSPKVRYVDLNGVLGGHRFCEPTEEGTWESMTRNAWLYAFEWPGCLPVESRARGLLCRNCGGLGELGEFQRVFHPKREGHEAYKKAIQEIVRKEFAT